MPDVVRLKVGQEANFSGPGNELDSAIRVRKWSRNQRTLGEELISECTLPHCLFFFFASGISWVAEVITKQDLRFRQSVRRQMLATDQCSPYTKSCRCASCWSLVWISSGTMAAKLSMASLEGLIKGQFRHYPWYIQVMGGIKSDVKSVEAGASQKHFKNYCFIFSVVFGGEW